MSELFYYVCRIAAPTILLLFFLLAFPKRLKVFRIFALILLFILFRDALTPVGLWKITDSLELRFLSDSLALWILAISSVFLVILSHFVIAPLNSIKIWIKKSSGEAILLGLVGGLLIALLPYFFGIVTTRVSLPKPEGFELILAIGALAFLGNLLEEVIFRGHFQNYLIEQELKKWHVIFLSAMAFSVCHVFLATTVTNVGWPILLFTFYEGIICAFVCFRSGLLSAVIAHGLGLFLVLTGILG